MRGREARNTSANSSGWVITLVLMVQVYCYQRNGQIEQLGLPGYLKQSNSEDFSMIFSLSFHVVEWFKKSFFKSENDASRYVQSSWKIDDSDSCLTLGTF